MVRHNGLMPNGDSGGDCSLFGEKPCLNHQRTSPRLMPCTTIRNRSWMVVYGCPAEFARKYFCASGLRNGTATPAKESSAKANTATFLAAAPPSVFSATAPQSGNLEGSSRYACFDLAAGGTSFAVETGFPCHQSMTVRPGGYYDTYRMQPRLVARNSCFWKEDIYGRAPQSVRRGNSASGAHFP